MELILWEDASVKLTVTIYELMNLYYNLLKVFYYLLKARGIEKERLYEEGTDGQGIFQFAQTVSSR